MKYASLITCLLPIAVQGLAGCSEKPLSPALGSNVVLIVVDTLRADATDGSWTNTPNLMALAQDGVRFQKAFSHAPSTLPSHTALFASRPPNQTGVINNGTDVPEDLPLLAEHLSGHGYQTRAIISLGTLNRRRLDGNPGLARGFDSFDQNYWHIDNAERALGRMQESLDQLNDENPFFLFAHFSDPHSPYSSHHEQEKSARMYLDGELLNVIPTSSTNTQIRDLELSAGEHLIEIVSDHVFKVKDFEFRKKINKLPGVWIDGSRKDEALKHAYRVTVDKSDTYLFRYWFSHSVPREQVRQNYKSEVEYVDRFVGELIGELKQRDWYQDTLILFASDHGESLGNPGRVGHMQNLKDELLHVPLIIKLPERHLGTGNLTTQSSSLVPLIDLVPTILDVIGLPKLPGQQGMSLLQEHSSILVAETHQPEARKSYLGIRDDRFKVIFAPDENRFLMYDLLEDPGEENDIYASAKHKREDWAGQLLLFNAIASKRPQDATELTESEISDLKALGYAGEDDE